jgi:hypothetical protein
MKTSLLRTIFILFITIVPSHVFAGCNTFNPDTNVLSIKSLGISVGGEVQTYISLDFIPNGLCDGDTKACLTMDSNSFTTSPTSTCANNDSTAYYNFNPFNPQYIITIPSLMVSDTEYYDAQFTFPVPCAGKNIACLRLDDISAKPAPIIETVIDTVDTVVDTVVDIVL